jgi:HSP20 family protein
MATRVPPVDIIDNSDELWVYVEAPGFQPEEIHVRGDETTLLVSAERPGEVEEGRNVVVHERAKQLERTIQLPAPVDVSGAELTYEDGVCKVMLPKAASERFTELTFR